MNKNTRTREQFIAYFWSKVGPPDPITGCREWQGCRSNKSYGQTSSIAYFGDYKWHGTHRLAYELVNGPISDGSLVRHSCDNPPCCEPAHLLQGTNADNMQDRKDRGGYAQGSQVWNAKLTEDDIIAIRELARDHTVGEISKLVGLHYMPVRAAIEGRTWQHVEAPTLEPADIQAVLVRQRQVKAQAKEAKRCAKSRARTERARAIRQEYLTTNASYSDLARKYSLDVSAISHIILNKREYDPTYTIPAIRNKQKEFVHRGGRPRKPLQPESLLPKRGVGRPRKHPLVAA